MAGKAGGSGDAVALGTRWLCVGGEGRFGGGSPHVTVRRPPPSSSSPSPPPFSLLPPPPPSPGGESPLPVISPAERAKVAAKEKGGTRSRSARPTAISGTPLPSSSSSSGAKPASSPLLLFSFSPPKPPGAPPGPGGRRAAACAARKRQRDPQKSPQEDGGGGPAAGRPPAGEGGAPPEGGWRRRRRRGGRWRSGLEEGDRAAQRLRHHRGQHHRLGDLRVAAGGAGPRGQRGGRPPALGRRRRRHRPRRPLLRRAGRHHPPLRRGLRLRHARLRRHGRVPAAVDGGAGDLPHQPGRHRPHLRQLRAAAPLPLLRPPGARPAPAGRRLPAAADVGELRQRALGHPGAGRLHRRQTAGARPHHRHRHRPHLQRRALLAGPPPGLLLLAAPHGGGHGAGLPPGLLRLRRLELPQLRHRGAGGPLPEPPARHRHLRPPRHLRLRLRQRGLRHRHVPPGAAGVQRRRRDLWGEGPGRHGVGDAAGRRALHLRRRQRVPLHLLAAVLRGGARGPPAGAVGHDPRGAADAHPRPHGHLRLHAADAGDGRHLHPH